mgnify:CR=1 FL=1
MVSSPLSLTDTQVFALCDTVRQAAFELHKFLCHGHLEKVYETGLVNRLRKGGLAVDQQFPLNVYDEDGSLLGEYFADLYVERFLIVELKTCRSLAHEHIAQVIGYLRTCQRRHALLINFGAPALQIRKIIL